MAAGSSGKQRSLPSALGLNEQRVFFCAGDSVLGLGPKLPYGESIRRGRFKCTSYRNGIRCVNTRNHHGFRLARRFARWF